MSKSRKSTKETFWGKVIKLEYCWSWGGRRTRKGYGLVYFGGRSTTAHRVAWELTYGPIPDHMEVCHNCPGGDNKWCVRPEHLFLSDHKGNMKDAVAKGVMRSGDAHWTRKRSVKGENHNSKKLTNSEVLEIRQLFRSGTITQRALAKKHGVSFPTISYIVAGKTWQIEEAGHSLCLRTSDHKRYSFTLKKTQCKHGHAFTEENTRVNEHGRRICRRCQSEYSRKLHAKQSLALLRATPL